MSDDGVAATHVLKRCSVRSRPRWANGSIAAAASSNEEHCQHEHGTSDETTHCKSSKPLSSKVRAIGAASNGLTTKVTGRGVDVDERSERATLIPLPFTALFCTIVRFFGEDGKVTATDSNVLFV